MPKFEVTLIRTTTRTAVVEITAEDEEVASEEAEAEATSQVNGEKSSLGPIEWELDNEAVEVDSVEEA